jgi:hypothetical protein
MPHEGRAGVAAEMLGIVHRLTGTAGSLGFDEIGTLASSVNAACVGLAHGADRPETMAPLVGALLAACRCEQVEAEPDSLIAVEAR